MIFLVAENCTDYKPTYQSKEEEKRLRITEKMRTKDVTQFQVKYRLGLCVETHQSFYLTSVFGQSCGVRDCELWTSELHNREQNTNVGETGVNK